MIFFVALILFANLAHFVTSAFLPTNGQISKSLKKRTDVTFAWKHYPVQNCSGGELVRARPEDSILAEDCQWVLTMITNNNGGFFELWDFDNADYKPLIGYKTCVFAVSHAVSNSSSDYAIVGNGDVAMIMGMVLANFQNDGHVATVTGNMTCGPNDANLSLLLYNGLTGDSGGPVNASVTSMLGDAWGGATATRRPARLPTVTMSPLGAATTAA